MRPIYAVYMGQTIYGLSYTWAGVKLMTDSLPLDAYWIEFWEKES